MTSPPPLGDAFAPPARSSSKDTLPILLLCLFVVGYLAVLWTTAPSVGYTRDEGYYFKAAEDYGRWWEVVFSKRFFEAFSDTEIQKYFSYNTEHPALVKLTQGVTFRVLYKWLGVATPSQGFRATGFLFAGIAITATFLLGRLLINAWVGLLGAVLLASEPRWFYDAHLACFDVPISGMWVLSLWAFLRAQEKPTRESVITCGAIFGLATATKLNALFLPFIFLPLVGWHYFSQSRSRATWISPGPSGGLDFRLPTIPWTLVSCAVLGPIIFIGHWPHLWHETFKRIGFYFGFHLNHEHYPALYFHDLLVRPPFPISFPFAMSLYTIPAPILALGVLGFVRSVVRALRNVSTGDAALVGATLLPVLVIALPSTPIFGGVKHWHNAQPTFCLLAAATLWAAVSSVWNAHGRQLVAFSTVGVAMALPGAFGAAATHPHGIGFYNEIAGGFRGGAELGMQRGFWGGLAGELYFEKKLPERGRIFFNRTNWDAFRMYQREDIIPSQVGYANEVKGATAGIVFEQPEHGEREAELWSQCGTRPVAGVYQDNVTLTQLYVQGVSSKPPLAPNP